MQPAERLAQRFLIDHPEAAAEVLAGLPAPEVAAALAALEAPAALALLTQMSRLAAARALEQLPAEAAAGLLAAMPLDGAVEVLRRVESARREQFLEALPPRRAQRLRNGLGRLRDSVAALMETRVLSLPLDATVEQARARIEQEPQEPGCHLYLTGTHGLFAGALSLRALYAAHPHSRLGSLPHESVPALPEGARSDLLAGHPGWLKAARLPVVDAGGRFVGVLSRARLAERDRAAVRREGGSLNMARAFLEGYATANALLLELLFKGIGRRD